MLDGNNILTNVLQSLDIDLANLIAQVSIWADSKTFDYLKHENGLGVFYPKTRRFRVGQDEKVNQIVDGIRLDHNSYANTAIKRAVGVDRDITNFTVCHIWPDSCYDHRYHTCIANLVLIPSAVAGISDHDQHTIACLKFRAFDLYKWHPVEQSPPTRPDRYPVRWREPVAFNNKIRKFINNRRQIVPSN
jgi:hypothetical protein